MYLRPSEIRFTQDSINNVFVGNSKHPNKPIGETLDDLLTGYLEISDILEIRVVKRGRVWYTLDNRRLWVFQKMEELEKCSGIPVRIVHDCLKDRQMKTGNGGRTILVLGDPGGHHWKVLLPPAIVDTHSSISWRARLRSRDSETSRSRRRKAFQRQIAEDIDNQK